ncbi:PRC-barrel domain protein [Halolamina pelagica]|uniref:PRC-barrel domain protein n=1 Tax=Halolamina pelagica TaxID=699431 RepID=A0A0P7H996_9EURY|nr:PRC-barrel domain protein [Halolamina pelagica]
MADILAENLSGKAVMGSDGTELGMLYNITMDLKTGELHDLLVSPNEDTPVGRSTSSATRAVGSGFPSPGCRP